MTSEEKTWLSRMRFMNRLLWGAILCDVVAVVLAYVGVIPDVVAGGLILLGLPFILAFVLVVFLNACPRCGKNFFVRTVGSPAAFGNPFTTKCLNCGLGWKEVR